MTDTATASAPAAPIVNPDANVDIKKLAFRFKEKTDAESGVKTKRPPIELAVKMISYEGIAAILMGTDEKERSLLLEATDAIYTDAIKSYLNDNEEITAANFPYEEFTWTKLANPSEADRKNKGIPKETWVEFLADWIAVMPGLLGQDKKIIEKQAAILGQRLNPLKNHEQKAKILPRFKEILGVYITAAPKAAEFAELVQYLIERADTLLNEKTETDLAKNLGF